MAHWVKDLTFSLCEDAGLIPGLSQWVKDMAFLQAGGSLQKQLRPSVAVAVA